MYNNIVNIILSIRVQGDVTDDRTGPTPQSHMMVKLLFIFVCNLSFASIKLRTGESMRQENCISLRNYCIEKHALSVLTWESLSFEMV